MLLQAVSGVYLAKLGGCGPELGWASPRIDLVSVNSRCRLDSVQQIQYLLHSVRSCHEKHMFLTTVASRWRFLSLHSRPLACIHPRYNSHNHSGENVCV